MNKSVIFYIRTKMEFLGKRTTHQDINNGRESPAKDLALYPNQIPEPNKGLQKQITASAKLAASAALASHAAEEASKAPSVFARERNPLLQETFESCVQYRYRISRVQEMSQYLAPFVSLDRELKARNNLGKNPLIQGTFRKQDSKSSMCPQVNSTLRQKLSQGRDTKGNLLLKVENELEYLECGFDFLEGYLKEESPEDLEELSQLSGIPISEFQFWLDNKVDLVQTLSDIQKNL